jgi:hypothetical protein
MGCTNGTSWRFNGILGVHTGIYIYTHTYTIIYTHIYMMITTPTLQQTLNILPNRGLDKKFSPTIAKMGSFSGSILVVSTVNGEKTSTYCGIYKASNFATR